MDGVCEGWGLGLGVVEEGSWGEVEVEVEGWHCDVCGFLCTYCVCVMRRVCCCDLRASEGRGKRR